MSTETATAPAPVTTDTGDSDTVHTYCECDPDIGLCGEDLTGAGYQRDDDPLCVVCEDLLYLPCERCGSAP
jgi:hypothetical protein